MKIAVIGVGMVGSQVAKWFKNCLTYDPNKETNSWEECLGADIFFLCLPTPYREGGYDIHLLEETIEKIPDGKIIVIKSTVLPGTTDMFQEKYPRKIFLFNPEFLTELSAEEDFKHPDMQAIGVPHPHYEIASKLMLMLPPSPVMRIVSPIDAEWLKIARNSFYTTKVIFFNEIYDIIKETSGDYETIRSMIVEDPRIGNSHSFIFHKGYRGAGGKCLPKDTYALLDISKSKLLKVVREINHKLTKGNDDKYAHGEL
jgi:UDPglucose 6-dehydrogenase